MPRIKVRVEIKKGGVGVKLHQLADISEQSLLFLTMLCKDAGIPVEREQWIALNFDNQSVDYDCETEMEVELPKVRDYNAGLKAVASEDYASANLPFQLRQGTIRQFSNIAASLDANQLIQFGIYHDPAHGVAETLPLTKEKASRIQKQVPEFVEYYGAIQGVIHALHKESDDPHITIREQVSRNLVKCYFSKEHYDEIVDLLRDRDAVVYTEGRISENVITGVLQSMQSERYRVLESVTYEFLDSIFGTDEQFRLAIAK
jgi:hypothetical protein